MRGADSTTPPARWTGQADGFPQRVNSAQNVPGGGSLITLTCGHVFAVGPDWFVDGWGEISLVCPLQHGLVIDGQGRATEVPADAGSELPAAIEASEQCVVPIEPTYPPPWRVKDAVLVDAKGQKLAAPSDPFDGIEFADLGVQAVIEAAPEMEGLLRDALTGDASEPGALNEMIDFLCERPAPNGGLGVGQGDVERMLKVLRRIRDKAAALLSQIDAARKAGG